MNDPKSERKLQNSDELVHPVLWLASKYVESYIVKTAKTIRPRGCSILDGIFHYRFAVATPAEEMRKSSGGP